MPRAALAPLKAPVVSISPANHPIPCDALCAALLDTPGVSTVTIAGTDFRGKTVGPISYRLVPKGEAGSNAMRPASPEQILQYLPEKAVSSGQRDFNAENAARKAQENAIIARWGLRLASDVTLSTVPSPAHHDLTITMTSPIQRGFHHIALKQAEVRDRDGRVLLRPSGTEPVLRVMVEGKDETRVRKLARDIAEAVEHAAGS